MKSRGLGGRLFWTVAPVVALLFAGGRLLLPGIPERASAGVFSLGVMPAVDAYVAVEVLAFLVPALRRVRHGNPQGRKKLERAARALALGLALFQAWSISRALVAIDTSPGAGMAGFTVSIPLVVASLVGGFCVTLLVADLVTRQGIVNGVVLVAAASGAVSVVAEARDGLRRAMVADTLDAPHAIVIAFAVTLVVIATIVALRPAALVRGTRLRAHHEAGSAYRDARALVAEPWVPTPSSSFAPYVIATSLLAIPVTLANMNVPGAKALGDAIAGMSSPVFAMVLVVTMAIAALVLARLLHRPGELTDLARRLGIATDAEADAKAKAARRRALPVTLLYLVTFALASMATSRVPYLHVQLLVVPALVALLMDAASAIRARDRVAVWEERRIAAVPVVRAALEAEGIVTATRGTAVLALFQAFVPYAPAEILVATDDADRATAILAHLFLGQPAPPRTPETDRRSPEGPDLAAWSRRAAIVLTLTACGAAGALGLAGMRSRPSYEGPRARLEVVRIDDTDDVLGHVHSETVPDFIEIRWENAPVGTDRYGQRETARVQFARISTEPSARAAADEWMRHLALPPGTRIAWEPTEDYDPDSGISKVDGYRSYLLTGDPILTTEDVVDAEAAVDTSGIPEIYVAVTLRREAAERFGQATREWLNRRIAIVLDGTITSAPVVRAEIAGGRISITMGAGDPEQQLAQARALARGLSGR